MMVAQLSRLRVTAAGPGSEQQQQAEHAAGSDEIEATLEVGSRCPLARFEFMNAGSVLCLQSLFAELARVQELAASLPSAAAQTSGTTPSAAAASAATLGASAGAAPAVALAPSSGLVPSKPAPVSASAAALATPAKSEVRRPL